MRSRLSSRVTPLKSIEDFCRFIAIDFRMAEFDLLRERYEHDNKSEADTLMPLRKIPDAGDLYQDLEQRYWK